MAPRTEVIVLAMAVDRNDQIVQQRIGINALSLPLTAKWTLHEPFWDSDFLQSNKPDQFIASRYATALAEIAEQTSVGRRSIESYKSPPTLH
jgi:hypothetical protein